MRLFFLKNYYHDNIPESIISYYEDYLQKRSYGDLKYDYENNRFILNKNKEYQKKQKQGNPVFIFFLLNKRLLIFFQYRIFRLIHLDGIVLHK